MKEQRGSSLEPCSNSYKPAKMFWFKDTIQNVAGTHLYDR